MWFDSARAGGRGGPPRCRRRPHSPVAPPAQGSPARRCRGLRHRDAVPPARCPRPRADAGPRGDGDAGASSCWCCAAWPRTSPTGPSPRPLVARRHRRPLRGLRLRTGCSPLPESGSATRSPTRSPRRAVEYGGGYNIVNVTLVDIRAWDTMGEMSVLVVAATGVASLIFLHHRPRRPAEPSRSAARGRSHGTLAARRPDPRSGASLDHLRGRHPAGVPHDDPLLGLAALLGHNSPGGGFAGGLMAASR